MGGVLGGFCTFELLLNLRWRWGELHVSTSGNVEMASSSAKMYAAGYVEGLLTYAAAGGCTVQRKRGLPPICCFTVSANRETMSDNADDR